MPRTFDYYADLQFSTSRDLSYLKGHEILEFTQFYKTKEETGTIFGTARAMM